MPGRSICARPLMESMGADMFCAERFGVRRVAGATFEGEAGLLDRCRPIFAGLPRIDPKAES